MTLRRSTTSRVRRPVVTMSVIAGLFVAATQAGATPSPQSDRTSPVLETAASRVSVNDRDRDYDSDRDRDRDRHRGDRALFTWTGRVDREVLIVVRGRDVSTRGFDAALPSRTRVNAALPRTNANVVVELNDGRGDVDVIEQPSARNGYQAVLRVRDPRAGADTYRLTAYIDDRYGRVDDRGNNRNGGAWGHNDRGNNRNDRNDRDGSYDNRGGRNQNNGSGALNWSGRVDDVVEIHVSGRRVDAITRSGVRVSEVNSNIRGGGLPNRNVNLQIDQRSGRGSIAVVQQPSAWNGYTAVIRINDSRSGAAYYDFTAYWE